MFGLVSPAGLSVRSMWGISNINASSLFKWCVLVVTPILVVVSPQARRRAF